MMKLKALILTKQQNPHLPHPPNHDPQHPPPPPPPHHHHHHHPGHRKERTAPSGGSGRRSDWTLGHGNRQVRVRPVAFWIIVGTLVIMAGWSAITATYFAFRDDVLAHFQAGKPLIDVRSPDEYSGKVIHMANYPQEGAQRAGHIPTAQNIPWATAANADGTFKSADELREIYGSRGITPDKPVVAYCRIGERSAHTWFVLTQLLGYPDVRNYDGSWTEWGSLVRAPIER